MQIVLGHKYVMAVKIKIAVSLEKRSYSASIASFKKALNGPSFPP